MHKKQKHKNYFLTQKLSSILLTLYLLLRTDSAFANIPAVVYYQHNGQSYYLIEVLEVRKGSHKYKCLCLNQSGIGVDSDYPLVISKAEYKAHKNELKWVPDNRPYNVAHPWLTKVVVICNVANLAMNVLGVCRL